MLRRLVDIACAVAAPRCRTCGRPMRCERETQIDPRRAAFELTFVCAPCGEREHRVKTYDFD